MALLCLFRSRFSGLLNLAFDPSGFRDPRFRLFCLAG
jgi:hypothetical protein